MSDEWDAQFYQSGTTIVCRKTTLRKPWFYIYADSAIDDDRYERDRMDMCLQLRDYLNGGKPRPKWLDDFHRISEEKAISVCGGSITATGPMIDKDPPNLFWVTDESDEAKNERARLMDILFLKAAEDQP